jgi:hypothetical protein
VRGVSVKLKEIARKKCANWDCGKCLGAIFVNKNNKLYIRIDKKLANKDCIVEKGCDYFKAYIKNF